MGMELGMIDEIRNKRSYKIGQNGGELQAI